MSGKERVLQVEAAKRLGISPQAIGQWTIKPGAPFVLEKGKRVLLWPDFPLWREHELLRQARADSKPADAAKALERKAIAEAMLAEIEVAEKEKTVVSVAVIDEVLGQRCDSLVAAISAMPANYQLDLEREGLDPKVAQRLLERIAEDLTSRLRDTADDDDRPDDA